MGSSRSPHSEDRSRSTQDRDRGYRDSKPKRYRDEEESDIHGGRDDRYRRRRYDERDRDIESRQGPDREKGKDRDGRYESSLRQVNRSRSKDKLDRRRNRDRDPDRDRGRGQEDRSRYRDRDDDRRAGPSTNTNPHYDRDRDSRRRHSSRSRSPAGSDSEAEKEDKKDVEKGKPNFKPSGLLAAATNTVRHSDGTSSILKYNEPPEARKPTVGWRLYVFKGKEQTDLFHIHRQSCYLIGRDKAVVDIYVEHPSCSKQHAVIQHRQVMQKDEFGNSKAVIKPFIIDLESTNETHVNGEAIPTSRFYELQMGDVIKFGMSTREYVLLHDDA